MPYQYKREPLNDDEVNAMTNACDAFREKFVVWTLLDTGLRLSGFAGLKKDNIQRQEKRLVIYGKGGPLRVRKQRNGSCPVTERLRKLMDYYFAENNDTGVTKRTVARIVKKVADKAGIPKPVSPHVLRHTFRSTASEKESPPEPFRPF